MSFLSINKYVDKIFNIFLLKKKHKKDRAGIKKCFIYFHCPNQRGRSENKGRIFIFFNYEARKRTEINSQDARIKTFPK
jgi:hypothetical protein